MLADCSATDHLGHPLRPQEDVEIRLDAFLESLVLGYLGFASKKALEKRK
jgi:hypothetical protein